VSGCAVGLAGGDSLRCAEGGGAKRGVGEQGADRCSDLVRRRVERKPDAGAEILDAACVESLIASERQHQQRDAVGEGERVDIIVNGVRSERPVTPWSRR
jgi:hypothetical protein